MQEKLMDEILSDLPMFDSVVQEIIALINNENTTAQKLEKYIKKDPVLSLKIIKLANSSFFSPMKPITNIAHSIRYIGFSTVKSLVYSIVLQAIGKNNKNKKIMKELQNRSLANAIIALKLGKNYLLRNKVNFTPDDFYVFGLFHDIGLLALANYDYENIFKPIYNEILNGKKILEAEDDYSHNLIGGKLMQKWDIPEVYADFVLKHHEEFSDEDKLYIPAKIIQLSERIAGEIGYDNFADKSIDIEEEIDRLNIHKEGIFDKDNQLTPLKQFVDDMLSGFAI